MLTFIRRWFVVTEWFTHITDDILQTLLVVYLQHNNFVPKGKDILNRLKSKKITPYVPFKGNFFSDYQHSQVSYSIFYFQNCFSKCTGWTFAWKTSS